MGLEFELRVLCQAFEKLLEGEEGLGEEVGLGSVLEVFEEIAEEVHREVVVFDNVADVFVLVGEHVLEYEENIIRLER